MDDLMTIGELSARTRLSRKALRLYGERGLLVPDRVEPRTGFRRYGTGQVERARRIALLRGIGMPLSDVAAVLDLDGEEAVRLLDAYWRQAEDEHAARRSLVAHARLVLTGGTPPSHGIAERDVPERKVVFLQRHVTAGELPGFLAAAAGELLGFLEAAGACLSGPLFAVYHGLVDEDSDGPVEVCAPTAAAVEPSGRIGVRIEPARREAFTRLTRRQCGFPAVLSAHDAVTAWLAGRGLAPSASGREVYHPNWATACDDEHVADVAYPFRSGGA